MDLTPQYDVEPLDALVGAWSTRSTHPMLPDVVVTGRATFEWLEGRKFLIGRSSAEHPQFPSALTVCGAPEGEPLTMRSFDSRGYERVYMTSLRDGVWRWWRDVPGFSQRFEGRLEDGGATISGLCHLSQDGSTWEPDLAVTYTREG